MDCSSEFTVEDYGIEYVETDENQALWSYIADHFGERSG